MKRSHFTALLVSAVLLPTGAMAENDAAPAVKTVRLTIVTAEGGG
jgi:hypothetical protein